MQTAAIDTILWWVMKKHRASREKTKAELAIIRGRKKEEAKVK
jgi:hypothetical protein